MHIHILGICGTFMGSLAQLAKASGHRVTGSDNNVYPPMSTQLEAAGIELIEGFDESQLELKPDMIVVGNVVSRGNPVMEAILDRGLPYISGPQWLSENILRNKWVLAVSGTHGKTTTSTMLAWILEFAGMSPGYLIGGVPQNFDCSARLGESDFFVIEADEYDTAFFDKRSKFVHYHARTLVINNLEYDHADIFPDLLAIQKQFHHLVRTVPRNGVVIRADAPEIDEVMAMGCWTDEQVMGGSGDWQYSLKDEAGSGFEIVHRGKACGDVAWPLTGLHNVQNALAAIAAARHVGVEPATACEALSKFSGVKRRMELLAKVGEVCIYDDFAHHPTAIETTLAGLRKFVGDTPIIGVIEPRSNTMKQGCHKTALEASVANANRVLWFQDAQLSWSLSDYVASKNKTSQKIASGQVAVSESAVYDSVDDIIDTLSKIDTSSPCHIVIMSNGGFQGIHQRLIKALQDKQG
ncbi:MAG: UDP-N-acetylmuramate:L-alanyl-gamma-D-glutamyl-meso-diaminopimelate ligase [Agarilytica sp.]